MDKIDPTLSRLIAAHAAGEVPPNPDNPENLVHVYVAAANGDFASLASAGYEPISELAGTAIIILPVAQIETLAARDDVLAIYAPPVGKPLAGQVVFSIDQKLVQLEQAYQVKSTARPHGTRGADVVVGIVDSGVNVMHDAFRTAAPDRKTRILFLWVQNDTIRPGTGPLWDRMGKVFTAAEIDALIAAHPSGHGMPAALLDPGGHGTGVASVAAGSAWPTDPPATQVQSGVAPDAQLIVVAGQRDEQAGLEFCFAKADALVPARPCVVNMSLGAHDLPHNGRSAFDQRVHALLTAKAGRVFVVAAGNDGAVHSHARVALPHPGALTLDIIVGPDQFRIGCLISGAKGGLKATVAPPLRQSGEARKFFTNGQVHQVNGQPRHKISVLPAGLPSDSDRHVVLKVESVADPTDRRNWFVSAGTWQLKLEPLADAQPVIDVWLQAGYNDDTQKIRPLSGSTPATEEALDDDPTFRRPKDWILHTLSSEACGRDAIVVGRAFVSRTDITYWGPGRASSRGPSTDASVPLLERKPDLIAPGSHIMVAKWTKPGTVAGKGVSESTAMSGTSFAAPFVAGTAALMLSHDPNLKHTDVLQILRAHAHPTFDNAEVQAWMVKNDVGDETIMGSGLLNARAAVAALNLINI